MTAVAQGADVAPAAAGSRPRRVRRLMPWPVLVAVIVLVAAEVGVRLARPSLDVPASQWPAPELEKKYDRIQTLSRLHAHPDVILVGDSMMDAAGDPDALDAATGLTVYNASVAGETLPVIAEWTTKVVVPRIPPRTVVIGFSSNELNPSVLAPAAGVAAYRASRAVRAAEGIGGPIDRADDWLRQHSMLYRYRVSLRHPLTTPTKQVSFDPALTATGQDRAFYSQRYLQVGSAAQAQAEVNGIIAALRGFTIGPKNVAILQDLIARLRQQGIAVLLVAMPVTQDLITLHPGGAGDYQRAMDTFATIAQRAGATFVQPGVWPTTMFADPVHLNGAGSTRFTKYLAPLLPKPLPAHQP